MPDLPPDIADVVAGLRRRSDELPAELSHRRIFIDTYRRTTEAVGEAVARGGFEDGDWVSRWDVVFAELFFVAHDRDLARRGSADGAPVPRPWRLAFGASPEAHPLLHLLLGLNAHINFDLPQSLLAVIPEPDVHDPPLIARRHRDHERIDAVLAERVAAEDRELGGPRRLRDRLLGPANRLASRRFLRESRRHVWHNTVALDGARRHGLEAYGSRLHELDVLTAAKITEIARPGPVLLRLAVTGFGVLLPPDEVGPTSG